MKNVNEAKPPNPRTEFKTRRMRESLFRKAYSVSLADSTSLLGRRQMALTAGISEALCPVPLSVHRLRDEKIVILEAF